MNRASHILSSAVVLVAWNIWAAEAPLQLEGLDWGREVDGIQCAVRPVKPFVTTGESIAVDVLYRNTTDEVRTVCVRPDPFWRWMQYQITDESGSIRTRSPISRWP